MTLRILVDKAGTVSRIAIEDPLGFGLDESAVDKVKTWRFKPATLNGEPVAMEAIVEVQFNLY